MYTKRQKVNIDDTRFIYATNFSGDPSRDRFGSDKRRVNVVIPTQEQADYLVSLGVKVKQTKPNPERTYDEPFVPTYFAPVTINMESKWPPHVYWITTTDRSTRFYSGQECLRSGQSRGEAQHSGRVQPVCGCHVCRAGCRCRSVCGTVCALCRTGSRHGRA